MYVSFLEIELFAYDEERALPWAHSTSPAIPEIPLDLDIPETMYLLFLYDAGCDAGRAIKISGTTRMTRAILLTKPGELY
jgi:hypothetical protein